MPNARNCNILVVEDSPLQQRLYDLVLGAHRGQGLEIAHASDGREALAELSRNPKTALIILDVNMPVMSGLEFLSRIKNEPLFRNIPVIICSTEDREEDVRRGLKLGAAAYILKPFRSAHLLAVISEVLSQSGVERPWAPGFAPDNPAESRRSPISTDRPADSPRFYSPPSGRRSRS